METWVIILVVVLVLALLGGLGYAWKSGKLNFGKKSGFDNNEYVDASIPPLNA